MLVHIFILNLLLKCFFHIQSDKFVLAFKCFFQLPSEIQLLQSQSLLYNGISTWNNSFNFRELQFCIWYKVVFYLGSCSWRELCFDNNSCPADLTGNFIQMAQQTLCFILFGSELLKALRIHGTADVTVLALAEGTFCAMFYPRWSSEANQINLICASLGDIIADFTSLARILDALWTAFTLQDHAKFTVSFRALQRPTVNLALHTMTLLTFLLPSVSTFIYHVSILIQTLTGQPRITFRATEKIHGWVFTVTDHPSTQDQATLAGADWAPVIF